MATLSNEQAARAMVANGAYADRLGWRAYATAIATAVGAPGATAESAELAQGIAAWQSEKGLSVDGIIGPQTWAAFKLALAPPDSVTGVRPADAPPVPDGIAAVIALYGDPRSYFSADGTIAAGATDDWERKTLAKGTLPWPIPTDGGVKKAFYAHRKLVSSFEAVFGEIDRLGLRELIKTFDGIYNFRPIRGTTTRISLHLFGAAIDLNAATNQRGTQGDMDPRVIDVFAHFGFCWGGDFAGLVDPMHFQYATGC